MKRVRLVLSLTDRQAYIIAKIYGYNKATPRTVKKYFEDILDKAVNNLENVAKEQGKICQTESQGSVNDAKQSLQQY